VRYLGDLLYSHLFSPLFCDQFPFIPISIQELRKARLELCSPEKSREEGSFGLAHCLDEAARTGEEGLTRRGDVGIRGRATVGAGAGLVIS